MPAPSPAETATTELTTRVHPHLVGMAAVYGYEVDIDENAIFEALPHLVLPGTEPGPLKITAELQHRSLDRDAYWVMPSKEEDGTKGAELTIYYTERDVRNRRGHQEVVLPAIKEAVNERNDSLRREASRYTNRRTAEAFTKCAVALGVPTVAAVLGAHEINGVSNDMQDHIAAFGGIGAFVTSTAATIRYGLYYGQRADLRRSPYQRLGKPIPEDLPPIVQFKRPSQ